MQKKCQEMKNVKPYLNMLENYASMLQATSPRVGIMSVHSYELPARVSGEVGWKQIGP